LDDGKSGRTKTWGFFQSGITFLLAGTAGGSVVFEMLGAEGGVCFPRRRIDSSGEFILLRGLFILRFLFGF
jgi:hypothetical protein